MFRRSTYARLLAVVFVVGCGGESDESNVDDVAVTMEPIIGGVAATGYVEAAYINMDATATAYYACSGALIAPKVVLTAGHCVDGHQRFEVYVAGAYRTSTSSAVYDWYEGGAETVNPAHHDVGLIFLTEPINIASYPTLSTSAVPDGTKVTNVGRVLNGTLTATLYQADTTVTSGATVGYPYDYQSPVVIQKGDSGGPVYKSGTHQIVAVNSGAGSSIQVLARVDLLSSWLNTQLSNHAVSTGVGGASSVGGSTSSATAKGGSTSSATAKGGSTSSTTAKGGSTSSTPAKGGSTSSSTAAMCKSLTEVEPNNTFTTAKALSGQICGSIASTTDTDWYSVSFAPGTHQLTLSTSLDATMNVGVVSGTKCTFSFTNTKGLNVKVSYATAKLCVQVNSPGKKTQPYQLLAK